MITLDFDITKNCNLKCKYCGAKEGCNKRIYNHNNEMNSLEIKSYLEMAKTVGCRILVIAGGEPLVREDLLEILRYSIGLGYSSSILTNGMLITDETAYQLSKSGVSYVRVSMESADKEQYEEYRGKGTFEKFKSAIQNLKQYDIVTGIGVTIYEENIDDIDNIIDFCLKYQINFVRIAPGLKIGRAKLLALGLDHWTNIIDKLQSALQRKLLNSISGFHIIPQNLHEFVTCSCGGGKYSYYLSPTGEVKSCPFIDNDIDIRQYKIEKPNDKNKFLALRTSMEQLMNYLPEVIGGKCAVCDLKHICRGGCLATKLHNDLSIYDEQPLCMKEILNNVVARNMRDGSFRKILGHWLHKLSIFKVRGIPLCIRYLPFWTIDFSQYHRLSK